MFDMMSECRCIFVLMAVLWGVCMGYAQATPWQPFALAPGLGPQEYPAVWGSWVVWQEFNSQRGDYDILVADVNLPKDRLILAIDDPNDQMHPAIWESTVVWQEYSIRRASQDWDIFLADLAGDEQGDIYIYPVSTVIDNDEQTPAIHGRTVVWEDGTVEQTDIYGADVTILGNFVEFPIAVFTENQSAPAIWRDRVLWQDDFNGDWDIFLSDIWLKDRVSEQSVAALEYDQQQVAIADGMAVWQDNTFGDWDLTGVDLTDFDEPRFFTVSNKSADQTNPAVSGEIVIYQDNRNGHWDIYANNPHTGIEVRVTRHSADQINPAIYGRLVVWQDNRNGDWAIFALWMDGPITDQSQSGPAKAKQATADSKILQTSQKKDR